MTNGQIIYRGVLRGILGLISFALFYWMLTEVSGFDTSAEFAAGGSAVVALLIWNDL